MTVIDANVNTGAPRAWVEVEVGGWRQNIIYPEIPEFQNLSNVLKDDFDINKFSNRKWVLSMFNVGNL